MECEGLSIEGLRPRSKEKVEEAIILILKFKLGKVTLQKVMTWVKLYGSFYSLEEIFITLDLS
jgi:hypothetical protein